MVMVGVFGWLVRWCWYVSLVVKDRGKDEGMEEIIIFNIICWYILYYFNQLFVKINIGMLGKLKRRKKKLEEKPIYCSTYLAFFFFFF